MSSGMMMIQENIVPGNLRKQLAVAVRSVQWSYAIFWSPSPSQQGVLQWGEGYYNGVIKTRKTFQTMELKPDKMGLQRSEQLRELYLSLLDGECSETQSKRPAASLSPEDLSDAEWYYLVCMSFVFSPSQGLPGSVLAAAQPTWLYNAQNADSKVFSRSLLAKSASIQTVLCFPYLGGVMELGVTELVQEDPNLIQHVKTSLLDFSKPDCSDKSMSAAHNADDNQDPMSALLIHNKAETEMDLEDINFPMEDLRFCQDGDLHEEFDMGSPDDCSFNTELHHQTEDSFMMEDVNGGASQVQSWHLIDDDFSIGVPGSVNSSDCISQVFEDQKNFSNSNKLKNRRCLKELQDCNDTKLSSLDITDEDLHYKRIVTTVLRRSAGPLSFHTRDCKSSFSAWSQMGLGNVQKFKPHQSILKKVLFEVPMMHCDNSLKPVGDDNDVCKDKMVTEDEKLLALWTMVPTISQADKASILDDTIKYVQQLEARVEELQSSTGLADDETENRKKPADTVEHTSDNYDSRNDSSKKTWVHKRKASHVEYGTEDSELNSITLKEGNAFDMNVRIQEQEVAIEIRCAWREYLLLDIMDAVNNLHLDAHSVQSATHDGIFTLSVNSKFRGTAIGSARMIKQAIWKVANKC
ncbi:unnamed protein product [Rhodiola kirilowii]